MNYIDGRTLKIVYCIDCRKEINWEAKRCRKCYHQFASGKNNGNYKTGKYCKDKKYYCKDCGEETSQCSALYGKGKCKRCARMKKNNPNYIHGKGREPYTSEFNKELKEKIKERDNYTCQICGIWEEEHIIVYGEVLSIHHIDYNKKNSDKNNLITLCKKCNLRANFNRDYWYAYFTYIMEEKLAKGD